MAVSSKKFVILIPSLLNHVTYTDPKIRELQRVKFSFELLDDEVYFLHDFMQKPCVADEIKPR